MTAASESPSCGNCRFYILMDGICRRYPPVVVHAPKRDGEFVSSFPRMQLTGWCGEHAPED
jgi:hypothetical protein